jgi:hypothetical protein
MLPSSSGLHKVSRNICTVEEMGELLHAMQYFCDVASFKFFKIVS